MYSLEGYHLEYCFMEIYIILSRSARSAFLWVSNLWPGLVHCVIFQERKRVMRWESSLDIRAVFTEQSGASKSVDKTHWVQENGYGRVNLSYRFHEYVTLPKAAGFCFQLVLAKIFPPGM